MPKSLLSESDRAALANLLFPDASDDLDEIRARYPRRSLPEGAMVTRFAPSPTGFIHIGSVLASLLNWKLAQQSGGIFILRVEDTDRERNVEGGVDLIKLALTSLGLDPQEGPDLPGAYGPYLQSERLDIYHAFAKDLVRKGRAYPCFMQPEELDLMRTEQKALKGEIGVHGSWAAWRDRPVADVQARIEAGDRFVLRLLAPAFPGERVDFQDRLRGPRTLAANAFDTVLIKSDGFPTYHFAHPIDDSLMDITVAIRGDEWLSTTPIHLQLFEAMGFEQLPIAHIAPVGKLDGTSRRKLSKRLDPEAAMDFYRAAGFPKTAIIEYLLNLLDSRFEDWRTQNPSLPFQDFEISLDNLSASNALFDLVKLTHVSREVIARLSEEQLLAEVAAWAQEHSPDTARWIAANPTYASRALNIGRMDEPPRKDITKWEDVPERYGFFFADRFGDLVPEGYGQLPELGQAELMAVIDFFLHDGPAPDGSAWFAQVKAHALAHGYAGNAKAVKRDPTAFKGTVGDFMGVLRVALTGRKDSPDLHAVMGILGPEEVRRRLELARAFVAAAD